MTDQPSVEEARYAVLTVWADGGLGAMERLVDALIAAVRSEGVAQGRRDTLREVREAVEGEQGYEPNTADGGLSMYTAVHGSWLLRAHILAALDRLEARA